MAHARTSADALRVLANAGRIVSDVLILRVVAGGLRASAGSEDRAVGGWFQVTTLEAEGEAEFSLAAKELKSALAALGKVATPRLEVEEGEPRRLLVSAEGYATSFNPVALPVVPKEPPVREWAASFMVLPATLEPAVKAAGEVSDYLDLIAREGSLSFEAKGRAGNRSATLTDRGEGSAAALFDCKRLASVLRAAKAVGGAKGMALLDLASDGAVRFVINGKGVTATFLLAARARPEEQEATA